MFSFCSLIDAGGCMEDIIVRISIPAFCTNNTIIILNEETNYS